MGHYIIECPLIPDPEMDLKQMPDAFNAALKAVLGILKGYGIDERIDASLKQFEGYQRCWLAMYIRESQFKGNLKFFVNTQTPGIIDAAVLPQHMTVEDVFEDSLFHEYGHVIEEWARMGGGGEGAYSLIYGPFSDEEDFAEYMVDYFRYHKDRSPRKKVVDSVLRMYVENVFR
jgi:hypothetical protein